MDLGERGLLTLAGVEPALARTALGGAPHAGEHRGRGPRRQRATFPQVRSDEGEDIDRLGHLAEEQRVEDVDRERPDRVGLDRLERRHEPRVRSGRRFPKTGLHAT